MKIDTRKSQNYFNNPDHERENDLPHAGNLCPDCYAITADDLVVELLCGWSN